MARNEVITENAIAGKGGDGMAVCPQNERYEGDLCESENVLVINPNAWVDCRVGTAGYRVDANIPGIAQRHDHWIELNRHTARLWPNITEVDMLLANAEAMAGKSNTLRNLFSEQSGEGS